MERFEIMTGEESGRTLEELPQRLADGESLREVCRGWGVPYVRMLLWLMEDEGRFGVYQRALRASAFREVEEAKDEADGATEGDVGARKLRVDVRFRRAKFHAPEVYGEREVVGVQVNVGSEEALRARLEELVPDEGARQALLGVVK